MYTPPTEAIRAITKELGDTPVSGVVALANSGEIASVYPEYFATQMIRAHFTAKDEIHEAELFMSGPAAKTIFSKNELDRISDDDQIKPFKTKGWEKRTLVGALRAPSVALGGDEKDGEETGASDLPTWAAMMLIYKRPDEQIGAAQPPEDFFYGFHEAGGDFILFDPPSSDDRRRIVAGLEYHLTS